MPIVIGSTVTSAEQRLQELGMGENGIQAFIDYLNIKKSKIGNQVITCENVYEKLLAYMKLKGFPKISIANVNNMVDYMNTAAKPLREDINAIINIWCDHHVCETNASELRDQYSFSGEQLSNATMASQIDNLTKVKPKGVGVDSKETQFYKHATSNSAPIQLTQTELAKLSAQSNRTYLSGTKKPCGDNFKCWICGNHIYTYSTKSHTKGGDSTKIKEYPLKCGEDEHVLPPGIGNIFGTLDHSYQTTIEAIHNKLPMMSIGLRGSHRFCNNLKSSVNLITPPANGAHGAGYSINDSRFEILMQKYKTNFDAVQKLDMHTELFDNITNPNIIQNIRDNMKPYLENLCVIANKIVPCAISTGSDNIRTLFLLRTVFNACVFTAKVYFDGNTQFDTKWKSNGGGGVKEEESNRLRDKKKSFNIEHNRFKTQYETRYARRLNDENSYVETEFANRNLQPIEDTSMLEVVNSHNTDDGIIKAIYSKINHTYDDLVELDCIFRDCVFDENDDDDSDYNPDDDSDYNPDDDSDYNPDGDGDGNGNGNVDVDEYIRDRDIVYVKILGSSYFMVNYTGSSYYGEIRGANIIIIPLFFGETHEIPILSKLEGDNLIRMIQTVGMGDLWALSYKHYNSYITNKNIVGGICSPSPDKKKK